MLDGREAIVLGKGIGFHKRPGDPVEERCIEKVYYVQDEMQTKFLQMLQNVEPSVMRAAEQILAMAENAGFSMSNQATISLIDHIGFAIERQKKNIDLPNLLLNETQLLYQKEYDLGRRSLKIIQDCCGVTLPEDEAGYIALHLVTISVDHNAAYGSLKFIKDYWILNYSNPAAIVSEACRVLRPKARIINICDMPIAIIDVVAAAMEIKDKENIVYDYFGLNHFGWFTPIEYKGKDYCNIGSPEDVAAVQANDGQGIGLFRSEFLYLQSCDYPTEEEQFEAYRSVAAAMNGKRVVIRTLDIGADKQVDYFQMKKEENPALGIRAIRICLNRPEVFRTQLRALYRASVYGKIAIMFPMITSVWEVKECKRACQSVMKELAAEGIPYDPDTELGIMIETPSSMFVAEELAKLVDFFSVGTNDLTQYTLACDRQANDLGKFYDPHHPALLRAIKMAADAAHKAGIWTGICGELGADISMLPTFLAMGIDELSVSPAAVLPLRAAIRQSIAQTCTLEKLEC